MSENGCATVKSDTDAANFDWLHEIRFDGYRMHARLDVGRAQILTRGARVATDAISGVRGVEEQVVPAPLVPAF